MFSNCTALNLEIWPILFEFFGFLCKITHCRQCRGRTCTLTIKEYDHALKIVHFQHISLKPKYGFCALQCSSHLYSIAELKPIGTAHFSTGYNTDIHFGLPLYFLTARPKSFSGIIQAYYLGIFRASCIFWVFLPLCHAQGHSIGTTWNTG